MPRSFRRVSIGDIVKALPAGAVEIDLESGDGGEMSISAGRSQFSVRPLALDDYPAQAEPTGEAVTLPAETMADALRQVVRAASTDDARAVLTGVLLASEDDGVRMVATDSYRLAVRDLPDSSVLGSGQKVLIPGRALSELQRLMGDVEELTVRFGEREATFESGTTRLSTRLIEGEFPNYRNLLAVELSEPAHRQQGIDDRGDPASEDPRSGFDSRAADPWR